MESQPKKHTKRSDYSWMSETEHEATLALRLICSKWVSDHFGEQCEEFEPSCECCKRWKLLEDLFGDC